jgi:flagellin-like hook-associated protein FlgL
MVGSIGQISPVVSVREARSASAAASPLARPVKTDWIDIANLGQSTLDQSPPTQRALNQLATGDSALNEVAGLLHNVKEAVAQPHDYSNDDTASQQLKIDASLASVDRIAVTTTFDGAPLLTGRAVITAGPQQITLPAISTTTLGATPNTQHTLGDLRTGGPLSIAAGNTATSTVVNAAITQVTQARTQIAGFKTQAHTQPAPESQAQIHESMQAIRQLILADGATAFAEGNRAAIVQMLK